MQKRVGVIRGGIGKNYTSSLRKGGELITHLRENLEERFKAVDILIDKEGVWHLGGRPIKPADLLYKVDVVWNTAHPEHGGMLKNISIPHIGADHFNGALEESKEMLARHMQKIGVSMPRSILLPAYLEDMDGSKEIYALNKAHDVHAKFGAPWMVKSFTEDKNMASPVGLWPRGIHLAKTFPELVNAIQDGVNHDKSILVEKFITGKIASLHTVPEFRGEKIYVFPLGNTFGIFSSTEKEEISLWTKKIYSHLGSPQYLKCDFVMDVRGKVHLLQVEFSPDLKLGSHFAEVCDLVGTKMHNVVEHILKQANK